VSKCLGEVKWCVATVDSEKERIMTQIFVDATLREKLQNLSQPLELLDENGELLGRFIPTPKLPDELTREPQLTEEEWKRLEDEPARYSTAEVLAYLEKR
jgi:hypothetical protein